MNKAPSAQMRPPLFVAQLPPRSDGGKNFQRVLIANRGEIACRIIATCRKLDLISIAIYADEDSTSLHVTEADEAVNLGSINQEGGNPFLNIRLLVDIAQSRRVDAIHPGYGYLSENESFADAVRQAGMAFIGPSSKAMSTLGDKRNSKDFLRKHAPSVPLIPGFTGSSQEVEELETAAEKVGFPVMLKASAGGGGRGMRIVRECSQLASELMRAQSEAKRSFGSSDCILEKYIEAAKHIEVQILGDSHGKVLSLWERECSVQRRHQKIIEETPSPFLTPEQRQKMCAVAVQIGELIGYEGAGTVEFVVDARDGTFYFLEVNTRLQVEHPITEEVTDLDIVSLQLFVAAGGSLASLVNLQQIQQHGHAIECRLCAEDPGNNFMPQNGVIPLWREADLHTGSTSASRDVRYETSVQTGSTVSIYFDSMIAKIVVWAPTRGAAITKMIKVLANTVCAGVKTNQHFLQACLSHHSFHDPSYTTSLIPTHLNSLLRYRPAEAAEDMMSMLSLVPGLLLRERPGHRKVAKPFRHVRQDFRNQYFDPVNVATTVVIPATEQSKPMLSIWKTSSQRQVEPVTYSVTLIAMPEVETPDLSTSDSPAVPNTAARALSSHYQSISHILRGGSLESAPQYTVQLKKYQPLPETSSSSNNVGLYPRWAAAFIAVSINASTIHAYVATDEDAFRRPSPSFATSSQPPTIFCHAPPLGTCIPFTAYPLLSYITSLRPRVASSLGSSTSATSRVIKSPMPCKILSVLKSSGDEVEAGDVVMVIESMKMETNVSVAVKGIFRTERKEGEAVRDGGLLCWVD